MGLAALLIPLIPPLVDGIMSIVSTIRDHDETPEALKAHLDEIWTDLQAVSIKVQEAQLPE